MILREFVNDYLLENKLWFLMVYIFFYKYEFGLESYLNENINLF